MIKFENVSITFNTKKATVNAVRNVSFEVNKGDIFGIVGTSGAGKSTLLRTVNLLEKPCSGKVNVDGVDITVLDKQSLRKARQKIAWFFSIITWYTLKQFMKMFPFPCETRLRPHTPRAFGWRSRHAECPRNLSAEAKRWHCRAGEPASCVRVDRGESSVKLSTGCGAGLVIFWHSLAINCAPVGENGN